MPEAIIWGASGGIGAAATTLLKDRGWKVYGAARHDERIPDSADARVHFEAGDAFSIQQAAMTIAYETTAVDLVVYAAGTMRTSLLKDLDADGWKGVIDANLTGVHLTTRASVDLLREGGHVVIIGAYVEKITLPRFGAYTVAKAALEPLVTILQKEHRKHKFTLLRTGAVATPFWENVPVKLPDYAAQPTVVAEAILARYESDTAGVYDI